MAQAQDIDSMTQLWLQYSEHFGGLDESQLDEFADMLSYRLQNRNTLCSNNTTDLFDLFYEHSQLLLEIQRDVCESNSISVVRDSVFINRIEGVPFVAEFLTLYSGSKQPSQPEGSHAIDAQKTSNSASIIRALSSTWGASRPLPLRATSQNPSTKWVGDPDPSKASCLPTK
jgi:hypothetical protein